jgi:hypothetical protein
VRATQLAAQPVAQQPLARQRDSAKKSLTLLLIDANIATRNELLEQFAAHGHRVVPASADQAADLGRHIHFDAVVWTLRAEGWKWSDYQDRLREVIPAFILVASEVVNGESHDGTSDLALAESLRASGGFLLRRPVGESELETVLGQVSGSLANRLQ